MLFPTSLAPFVTLCVAKETWSFLMEDLSAQVNPDFSILTYSINLLIRSPLSLKAKIISHESRVHASIASKNILETPHLPNYYIRQGTIFYPSVPLLLREFLPVGFQYLNERALSNTARKKFEHNVFRGTGVPEEVIEIRIPHIIWIFLPVHHVSLPFSDDLILFIVHRPSRPPEPKGNILLHTLTCEAAFDG